MAETGMKSAFDAQAPAVQKALANLRTPWKMKMYFLSKLPTLLYWRVKIKSIDTDTCSVTIPFRRSTQNPFASIYFASQAGAAELSTGMLGMLAMEGRGRISMLIVNMEAEYTKKADTLTTFTCTDGPLLQQAVQQAIETGEGVAVTVTSVGRRADGTEVSRFRFTWSFKVKSSAK